MRFGGPLPWAGPLATASNLVTVARAVEELGYEWVSGGEYLLYPKSRPIPMPGAGLALDPSANEHELLTLFSWLAGQTTRLRFQTAMMILTYRSPFVVAKQIATLDYLSGGRFALGVSAGWMRDEFEIYKIPYARRGALLDEYLGLVRSLLESGGPFDGETYTVPESWFAPRPVQQPLPLVIGGGPVEPVLRRVARYGQVWNPYGCGLASISTALVRIRELLCSEGRDGQEIGVQTYVPVNLDPAAGLVSTKEQLVTRIRRMADAGVTDLAVTAGELGSASLGAAAPSLGHVLDAAEWFAREIIPEVAHA
jgi:probable F420-dependent oxidoreductase